jgi:hypothetical protein
MIQSLTIATAFTFDGEPIERIVIVFQAHAGATGYHANIQPQNM